MVNTKKMIKGNREKQRAFVEVHEKKLREVIKPQLREKKRARSKLTEEIQEQIYEKGSIQKEKVRDHIKGVQKTQRVGVKVQKETIWIQQIKQRETGKKQTEDQQEKIRPIIEKNRNKVEKHKSDKRAEDRSKGKRLFAFSTMPSNKFADSTTYVPKLLTVPDAEFAGKLTYSPNYSVTPDPKFAEKVAYFPKHSTVSKSEFAEGITYSPKHSTLPKPEFAENPLIRLKYSTMKFKKTEKVAKKRGI